MPPEADPTPPDRETPPMTQAATALRVIAEPMRGSPPPKLLLMATPAIQAVKAEKI